MIDEIIVVCYFPSDVLLFFMICVSKSLFQGKQGELGEPKLIEVDPRAETFSRSCYFWKNAMATNYAM